MDTIPCFLPLASEYNAHVQMQHKHFNELLNGLKLSPPSSATSSISYTHLRLIDSFYQSPDSRDKIRVTRDEKTGKVEQCVRKVRLGDLDIYSPKRAADWRISVNVEVPGTYLASTRRSSSAVPASPVVHHRLVVPPPIGTASHTRRKDRMSYTHEEFNIDLTQVTSNTGSGAKVNRIRHVPPHTAQLHTAGSLS